MTLFKLLASYRLSPPPKKKHLYTHNVCRFHYILKMKCILINTLYNYSKCIVLDNCSVVRESACGLMVSHLIPVKGTYFGCKLDPWPVWAHVGGNQPMYLTSMFLSLCLSLSLSLPLSLKINGKNILK
uniref:Uncharacterized protein n=1 Tax=Myotis myotis TaxID=51298 RepID=A0A7J8AME0_MYOMY|nr:hypothetical protein mMyoMyo1_008030 [Myotis myotis]